MWVIALHTLILVCTLYNTPSPEVIATRAYDLHAKVTSKEAHNLTQAIYEASTDWFIPSAIITAVIEHETTYKPNSKSRFNCQGPMQLLPKTAKKLARRLGLKKTNLLNVKTNIWLGAAYLAELFERYHKWGATLTAYNIGPGKYERKHRDNNYAKAILRNIPKIQKREAFYQKPGPVCSLKEFEETVALEPNMCYSFEHVFPSL